MSLTVEERKRTGTYYTSESIADFLASASIRSPADRVLEPCFGQGVFLQACERRLATLSGQLAPHQPLVGVDADRIAVTEARRRFPSVHLVEADFFSIDPGALGRFDVVIGNPPFVRYHRFCGPQRELGLRRARAAGVEFSALTSAWAPFLTHASQHLAPGGRLAVVAPLELTYARYARPFIAFLCGHFGAVRVLLFDEPLFPDLNEATVLVVAEGWGGSCRGMTLVHLRAASDLAPDAFWAAPGIQAVASEWACDTVHPRLYRLPEDVRRLYRSIGERVLRLGDLADLTIGYVTGANGWFHLSPGEVALYGLQADVRLVLRRAGDLTGLGLSLTEADRTALGERGAHWLLVPREPIRQAAVRYVSDAERAGVSRAYKCRVRDPWWRVPGVRSHQFVVGVLSTGSPRLVAADVPATNSLLVGDLRAAGDPRTLAAASLTSFAALSAEVVGHALGGGALKLEPGEARRWALPLLARGMPGTGGRGTTVDAIDALMNGGRVADAAEAADRLFLRAGLGLTAGEVRALRSAADVLRKQRLRNAHASPARLR